MTEIQTFTTPHVVDVMVPTTETFMCAGSGYSKVLCKLKGDKRCLNVNTCFVNFWCVDSTEIVHNTICPTEWSTSYVIITLNTIEFCWI